MSDLTARLSLAEPGTKDYWTQCGVCGQLIGLVMDGRYQITEGWRLTSGVWRPTRRHLERRAHLRRVLNTPGAADEKRGRARRRLQVSWGMERTRRTRNPDMALTRICSPDRPEAGPGGRVRLPVRVACPRCHRVNQILPPSP
jgi:hypothetical protein